MEIGSGLFDPSMTVSIDESFSHIFSKLTAGDDIVMSPFRTSKDLFLWAVSVGFKKGGRKTVEGKKVSAFKWSQLNHDQDIAVLKAIAVASSDDVSVILDQAEIIRISEEYANSGIHILAEALSGDSEPPLWAFLKMM